MKILMKIVLSLSVLVIVGCSNSVDDIKNARMNYNPNMTLGEAFEAWDNCKDLNWEIVKQDDTKTIYHVTCDVAGVEDYFSKALIFQEKIQNKPRDKYSYKAELTKEQKQEELDALKLTENKLTYQFTQVGENVRYDGIQGYMKWEDGLTHTFDNNQPMYMTNVYENSTDFLNEPTYPMVSMYSGVYQLIREQIRKEAK